MFVNETHLEGVDLSYIGGTQLGLYLMVLAFVIVAIGIWLMNTLDITKQGLQVIGVIIIVLVGIVGYFSTTIYQKAGEQEDKAYTEFVKNVKADSKKTFKENDFGGELEVRAYVKQDVDRLLKENKDKKDVTKFIEKTMVGDRVSAIEEIIVAEYNVNRTKKDEDKDKEDVDNEEEEDKEDKEDKEEEDSEDKEDN